MAGHEIEDLLAVLDAAAGGQRHAEDALRFGVVAVGAEQEAALDHEPEIGLLDFSCIRLADRCDGVGKVNRAFGQVDLAIEF